VKRSQLGGLDVVVRGDGTGPTVVLLHGYGAPAEDLVPLAWHMKAPPGTRFVCPAAPIALGLPFADARAWWHIDAGRIARGGGLDVEEVPAGLAAARDRVVALLDELGAPPERTVLGGFSQGAMLATDVTLRTGRPLAGLILFSGTLMCASEWTPLMRARRGLPIYQSHGSADPLLPYAAALRLRALWEEAGADVSFTSFDGGHDIPPAAVEGAEAFLCRRFS
jgi:phospholipase/carboxylesterase